MDEAREFETARASLVGQAENEVLTLRNYLGSIDENDFLTNDQILSDAILRVFYVAEGLKKIANVLQYVDAWEENGDPPQLSYMKNEDEHKFQ